MEDNINWESTEYWNEYYKYDEYFLSLHLDQCRIHRDKWIELVKKWSLNTRVIIGDSIYDPDGEDVSVFNEDYSIVISGINYQEIPGYYLILTFSKNVDMSTAIKFFIDFEDSLEHYTDIQIREGITGEYTTHPKEIIKMMIHKL